MTPALTHRDSGPASPPPAPPHREPSGAFVTRLGSWLLGGLLAADLLVSPRNPYPYGAAAASLGAALLGAAAGRVAADALRMRGARTPHMARWLLAGPGAFWRTVLVIAAAGALRPGSDVPSAVGAGQGLGSWPEAGPPFPAPTGAALLYEQGLPGAVAFALLILGALLAGKTADRSAATGDVGDAGNAGARIAWRLGAAALTALLLVGGRWPAFGTGATAAGTGVFALAVALAARSGVAESGCRSRPVLGPLPWVTCLRRSRQFAAACALVALGTAAGVGGPCLWARRTVGGYAARSARETRTPLAGVSEDLRRCTVAMEDANFYAHRGVDARAVHRALRANLRALRLKGGGSTITQQLAKNLFLSPERTARRKILEAFLALELERRLTKAEILERYLNVIDYGMGQRGITEAARFYFHKEPAGLTLAESAFLVGLVPAPPRDERALYDGRLTRGRDRALDRAGAAFPAVYPEPVRRAAALPADRVIYPARYAWDRGARESVPGDWGGVAWYSFAAPATPAPIAYVAPALKARLAAFARQVQRRYAVTAIDHLGVYNARTQRGSASALSAHAFGQAIDISGFRFADGTRVRVDAHGDPAVAARLAGPRALLRQQFEVLLDWENEPLRHQDHFHAEVKGLRPGAPEAAPAAREGMRIALTTGSSAEGSAATVTTPRGSASAGAAEREPRQ